MALSLIAIIVIAVTGSLGYFTPGLSMSLGGISFGVFVAGLSFLVYGGSLGRNYQRIAAKAVLKEAAPRLFPGAIVKAGEGLPLETVLYPGFFKRPDRYKGRLYYSALYKGIPFETAHYDLIEAVKSKNGTSYVSYAKGTLFRFKLKRDFAATVRILEKKGKAINLTGLKEVETESIAFNEKFQILASDEKAAFLLLSPSMITSLLDLEKDFPGGLYVAFVDDGLFVAIDDSDAGEAIYSLESPLDEATKKKGEQLILLPVFLIDHLDVDDGKFAS